MKRLTLLIVLLSATLMSMAQSNDSIKEKNDSGLTFVVEGTAKSYNQVRIINETTLDYFQCRVVIFNADNSVKEIFGVFDLNGKGDSDSNTKKDNKIPKGSKLGIQFPKNITNEFSFNVEYQDYPFFDAIIIHLTDDSAYETNQEEEY